MLEKQMRKRVLDALRPLHAVPIETGIAEGVPDVNCTAGWIELKQLPAWPKRADTPVRLPKFTKEQRDWLAVRWSAKPDSSWLLLHVGDRVGDWLLFTGDAGMTSYIGWRSRSWLLANSVKSWEGGLVDAELLEFLKRYA